MKLLSAVSGICLILLLGLCLSCGGSTGQPTPTAKETPSAEEATGAAGAMAGEAEEPGEEAEELGEEGEATIDEMKADLAGKKAELEHVTQEIKGLSPTDLAGEAGQKLKEKSETLSAEIKKLEDEVESHSRTE